MLKHISKMSLRLRMFLFFLFLGLRIPLLLGTTLYFAESHIRTHGDMATSLLLFGLCVGLGLTSIHHRQSSL